jgi:glycosyltransferase involved in cell wall biosynthesis
MNVTTSVFWTRPAVGIIRVEQELSRELANLFANDEYGLCIFKDGEFSPFDTDQTPIPVAPPSSKPDDVSRFPRSSTFERIWPGRRKSLRSQKATPQVVEHVKIKHPQQTIEATYKDQKEIVARKIAYGDIILSVGLDWDQSYIDEFERLKQERGIKIITCCYDLIPVLFPQYCVGSVASQFKDYFTKVSWASSLILCISERTRADYRNLVRAIGAPEAETIVMPLGDNVAGALVTQKNGEDDDPSNDISPDIVSATERRFILFVSTIERRKNHEVLYRAYHLLARAGHGDRLPRLIFVGMPGWGVSDLLKDIEFDHLTRDLIVQLNHVTDHELNWLYERAYFCAYPSLYEGWGLPVGEALARGKAVIASAEGSIPEVGGDLVTYIDPWNPQAWADEILALASDPERVTEMEMAVRQSYRARTWRDTALTVKDAMHRLREPSAISITLYPGYHLKTSKGVAWGGAIRSDGTAGTLTYGPDRWLPAGSYVVQITLEKFDGEAGEIAFAFRSSRQKKEYGSLKLTFDKAGNSEHIHDLHVELEEDIEDYEIYSSISSGLKISVNRIDITEL